MTPYLDVGFLSTLLIKTRGRKLAWNNLHKFDPPYALNLLHHLQIDNLLVRCQLDSDDGIKTAGLEGARLWRFYSQEGVFHIQPVTWGCRFARGHQLDADPHSERSLSLDSPRRVGRREWGNTLFEFRSSRASVRSACGSKSSS